VVREQLLRHQEVVTEQILTRGFEPLHLGEYALPTTSSGFFRCWGGTERRDELRYEITSHQCQVDDQIYLARGAGSGTVSFTHALIRSDELNPWAFFSLYQSRFQATQFPPFGLPEYVAPFACTTEFVAREASTLKVVFCARGYRKLKGLYDAILKVASLDHDDHGVQSTLTLLGVSYENAKRIARRYLESVTRTNP